MSKKKKKKLKLEDLKAESFITNVNDENSNTVKGGTSLGCIATATFASVATAVTYSVYKLTEAASCNTNCEPPQQQENGICNTGAYCGNTHQGGNGCTIVVCR